MKKYMKKIVSFMLVLLLIFTSCIALDTTSVMAATKKPAKITLNYKSTTSYVGGSVKLKVTLVTPKNALKSVKWKSSNTKIATVSSKGVVKSKKSGTVTITATSKVRPSVKAKCKIKIYNTTKTLKLDTKKSYTLKVGDTQTLKATITSPKKGAQPVQWISENSKIAKVDSKGKVTAVKAGTTNIVARSGAKKARTKITVVDNQETDDNEIFSLLQTEYTIENIQLMKLSIVNDPGNIVWKSENPNIADVIDGKVFALTAGTTKITGTSGSHSVTITVTVTNSIMFKEPVQKVTLKKLTNCYLIICDNAKVPDNVEAQIQTAVSNVENFTGLKFMNEKFDLLPYIVIAPLGQYEPCSSGGDGIFVDDLSIENKDIYEDSTIGVTLHELMHCIRMRSYIYGGTPYEEGLAMYNAWLIENEVYGYNEVNHLNGNSLNNPEFQNEKITPETLDKYLFEESPDSHVTSAYFVQYMVEKYGMKTIDDIIREAHTHVNGYFDQFASSMDKYLKDATVKYTSENVVLDFYNWLVENQYLQQA